MTLLSLITYNNPAVCDIQTPMSQYYVTLQSAAGPAMWTHGTSLPTAGLAMGCGCQLLAAWLWYHNQPLLHQTPSVLNALLRVGLQWNIFTLLQKLCC